MKRKILIVEDNVGLSQMQKDWFSQAGYEAVTVMNELIARSLIRKTQFDLILSDVRLPEGDGISLLEWLRKEKKDIPFIITTEYVSVPDVVRTIKLGAIDYLPKPVRKEHLLELAEDVFRPMVIIRKQEKNLFHRTSPKILQVEKYAKLVAPSEMAVMILGANGTGKESVAQYIHQGSERQHMPFVAVNCGALPRELAASLLFGHEKGAFTGADTAKVGYFDMAKGGTLFLDEIGTMSYEIQSMLLRVLQESTYMPIGSSKERVADVRIVSATNEDLQQAIKEGRFREDLYHRLNEFEIQQPSLAECPEDILPLAEFFRERYSKELKRETCGFTDDAKRRMLAYPWPGNVRELQNKIKRSVLVSEEPILDIEGLDNGIPSCDNAQTSIPAVLPLKDESLEKKNIANALKACNGHREQAAAMLNVNPATLYRKMKKYGLK
ncbi:sigma-54-dependent transcriptional regulator [Bacteroides stercoris]|uniref:Sigma-54-dependent Fis family transcriptional regulator n=1 Tax=Bacteroides stercoris TaxID=46506 RepID=A0A412DDZ6_BACSE|nr:sigma-54 dependent transcriptional regulator [Bacteroides stercoris]MDC2315981.1 sigma-54 dependent transcriptional regulator [Bacteroides stercoris]MDC2319114.1 sigma-54 dependent transcriptional regulator [Bacteroides stercoris]MDC2322250.1 sigma-54 dependent transcriptional regulator [Bacteroides stercoris]MDC2325397.1 sigma-54 dependent transcriptional regulator [Bacteroides stercoris]MDC2328519.1 sigma-54 dependent transcriptional regulator [Bacteroides stercoris]